MSRFRVKIFQLPKGAKFIFNGVEFVRGDCIYKEQSYKCESDKFILYLHKDTFVEPYQEERNESC